MNHGIWLVYVSSCVCSWNDVYFSLQRSRGLEEESYGGWKQSSCVEWGRCWNQESVCELSCDCNCLLFWSFKELHCDGFLLFWSFKELHCDGFQVSAVLVMMCLYASDLMLFLFYLTIQLDNYCYIWCGVIYSSFIILYYLNRGIHFLGLVWSSMYR